MELTPVQVRVLGALIEKEMATPDYYPLTLNALVAACNQSSNRSPVMQLDDATVQSALDELRAANLTRIVYSRSNRAAKFRHVLDEALHLEPADLAAMAVLMLRGPQTASEVRARSERLHQFESQGELDDVLTRLGQRDRPLVVRLERQPGQKEARWAHLLAGEPDLSAVAPVTAAAAAAPRRDERVEALEARVEALEGELARIKADLGLD
jgi:uncharacterized protein